MTRLLQGLLLVALLVPGARAQDRLVSAIPVGSALPLPDRAMAVVNAGSLDRTSATTTFAQAAGPRGLVVVFWCVTCPWVGRYESRVVALAEAYTDRGYGFVAVNANDAQQSPGDGVPQMVEQAARFEYSFPYVVDGGSEAARAFGATRTPQVFVFDAAGVLRYEGAVDDSPRDAGAVQERYAANALTALLAGRDVDPSKTRSIGCTIKFSE